MTPQETSGSLENNPNHSDGSIRKQYNETQQEIAQIKDAIRMLQTKINELEGKVDEILFIHNNSGDVTEN